uniref:Uncharacterized protein n=1 Tax=Anguilla anguilla TaxID=7936 RepID=A0A0E9RAM2_ANGAN
MLSVNEAANRWEMTQSVSVFLLIGVWKRQLDISKLPFLSWFIPPKRVIVM